MGDRFYFQQYKLTHPECKQPRKSKVAWTDEKKAEVIKEYLARDPSPEDSAEIVKELAEEFEESPNGVRMILVKADVYVKKTAAATTGKAKAGATTGAGRVSKESSQKALSDAIQGAGQEVDEDIISKLTGKAAVYLAAVISAINTK